MSFSIEAFLKGLEGQKIPEGLEVISIIPLEKDRFRAQIRCSFSTIAEIIPPEYKTERELLSAGLDYEFLLIWSENSGLLNIERTEVISSVMDVWDAALVKVNERNRLSTLISRAAIESDSFGVVYCIINAGIPIMEEIDTSEEQRRIIEQTLLSWFLRFTFEAVIGIYKFQTKFNTPAPRAVN